MNQGSTGQVGPKGSKRMTMLRLKAGHGDSMPRTEREQAPCTLILGVTTGVCGWELGHLSFPWKLQFACQTVGDG